MHCLESYLDRICAGLNLPDDELDAIREEIESHLLEAAAGKTCETISDEEALAAAIRDVGDPDELRNHYRTAYLKQHRMRVFSRLAGIGGLAWLLYYSFAFIDVSMSAYFNLSAFLLVPVSATLLLLGSYGLRDLGQALAAPFSLYLASSTLQWDRVANLYRTWAVNMLGCGLIAAALGAHQTCWLVDHSMPIGPGLALGMMGLIFGTFLSGVLWTFALSLPKDGRAPEIKQTSRIRGLAAMAGFLLLIALTWYQDLPPLRHHALLFVPAGLFVLIGAAALALATFGFKGCSKIFREPSKLRTLSAYFWIIGFLGFVNHIVLGLSSLADMNQFHMGISKALLLLLYGMLLGLFCWVLAGPLGPSGRKASTGGKLIPGC